MGQGRLTSTGSRVGFQPGTSFCEVSGGRGVGGGFDSPAADQRDMNQDAVN